MSVLLFFFYFIHGSDNLIVVERQPTYIDSHNQFQVVPYKERQSKWSHTVGIVSGWQSLPEYLSFNTDLYAEEIINQDFMSATELRYFVGYNMSVGSLSGGLGIRTASVSDDQVVEASLSIMQYSGFFRFDFNRLSTGPYWVPYVSLGLYQIAYSETYDDLSDEDYTTIGLFYNLGVLIQLNWLDYVGFLKSLLENNIENTFLVLEASQNMDTSIDFDSYGNFQSGLDGYIGVQVEF